MSGRRLGIVGAALLLGGLVLIGAGGVLAGQLGQSATSTWPQGMMGGAGMMGSGVVPGGMMGGAWGSGTSSPGPGEAGFVAGTPNAPRAVRILATPNLRFSPDTIRVQAGETIRFEVTTMGPLTHEFMVGPAADVAADTAGTPEVADIGMMQTAALIYTFSGPGPFAFACHATGHYEAGMAGTIIVVN